MTLLSEMAQKEGLNSPWRLGGEGPYSQWGPDLDAAQVAWP